MRIIANYMVHVRETTTKVYVHDLLAGEYQLLLNNSDYFLPLSLQFAPDSLKVLECYPSKQAMSLKNE